MKFKTAERSSRTQHEIVSGNGAWREKRREDGIPGITNYIFSETAARGMYQRWADLLSSESWQEVHEKTAALPAGGDEMSTLVSLELHHRISQFLYEEARMLDDWQFRDWLAQLDDDIRYTMRTTVNAQTRDRRKGVQPPTTGFSTTTKTSSNAASRGWKPAWHGRKNRRRVPVI